MSEQQAEAIHGESGSVSAASSVSPSSDASSEAAAAANLAASVLAAPAIAPDHEAPPRDEIKKDEVTPEAKIQAPPIELPKRSVPRAAGKVLIMAPSDRTWHDHSADVKVEAEAAPKVEVKSDKSDKPKRSFPAMAAMHMARVKRSPRSSKTILQEASDAVGHRNTFETDLRGLANRP